MWKWQWDTPVEEKESGEEILRTRYINYVVTFHTAVALHSKLLCQCFRTDTLAHQRPATVPRTMQS